MGATGGKAKCGEGKGCCGARAGQRLDFEERGDVPVFAEVDPVGTAADLACNNTSAEQRPQEQASCGSRDAGGRPDAAGQKLDTFDAVIPDNNEAPNAEATPSSAEDAAAKATSASHDEAVVKYDDQEEAVVKYEDGSTYTGQLYKQVREGQGIWKSKTGSYEGQWRGGCQDGTGKQTWTDGINYEGYEGQFLAGRFHGKGLMEWRSPQGVMSYDGEYREDMKHGRGKFAWHDGRVYDGEWDNGKRWGKGTFIDPKGTRKEGIWAADKLERWL